jgi:hypothetical protein
MTDESGAYARAVNAERAGDPGEAARWYALTGFEHLVEAEYDFDSSRTREGTTFLLVAMSCDVRDGNRRRAAGHFEIADPLLDDLARSATDACLEGLAREWRGDARLLANEDGATEQYEAALTAFETVSFEDRMFWGATPAFDNAYGAMKTFLSEYNIEYPGSYTMEFTERVETKRSACEDIRGGG